MAVVEYRLLANVPDWASEFGANEWAAVIADVITAEWLDTIEILPLTCVITNQSVGGIPGSPVVVRIAWVLTQSSHTPAWIHGSRFRVFDPTVLASGTITLTPWSAQRSRNQRCSSGVNRDDKAYGRTQLSPSDA